MESFTDGSIQTIWTVLFNLEVETTAPDLEFILLQSIVDETDGDGILITGTQTLGNLTLAVATIDVDCKYQFKCGSHSVKADSYLCFSMALYKAMKGKHCSALSNVQG